MSNRSCRDQGLPELAETEEEEEEEEEEEDGDYHAAEEAKVCQVCGDRATGYHFNAMTCEGCKGFFRRAMKRSVKFSCPFQGACVITKCNRRQCQACRLRKCQDIGMLKELIMSDEAVEQRRRFIRMKRGLEETVPLTPQQEAIIQELLDAHKKSFDMTFSHFKQFRPIDRNLAPMHENSLVSSDPMACLRPQDEPTGASFHYSDSSSSSRDEEKTNESGERDRPFSTLPHVADLTTYMIQQIIDFAKFLTCFKELSIEDQISLLKGATFEVCQIRFNMLFNKKTGMWECGPLTYCMDDAARAGFQRHLLDPLMKFHYTLKNMQLDEPEYVLMQAISLFSPDRPGVTDHKVVDRHQEMFALTLKMYIEAKRTSSDKHLLFPRIMACLTEMRSMNEEYSKQVLQIQDIQPDVSPLILEVVSKDP